MIDWWMIEYNQEQPHDQLTNLTPINYGANHARNFTIELPLPMVFQLRRFQRPNCYSQANQH